MIEIETVERAAKGDNDAREQLYTDTYQKMYRIAYSELNNSSDAEDVLQESYITAFRKLLTLNNALMFESWLTTIVVRKCHDLLRKNKTRQFIPLDGDDDDESAAMQFSDDSKELDPGSHIERKEVSRIIREMLSELPGEQRECIVLFYSREMKISEIAQTLDIPENTVKSRLFYGKKKFKRMVGEREKRGEKLYGISGSTVIPFLIWLLRRDNGDVIAPQCPTSAPAGSAVSAGSSAAGAGTANTAGAARFAGIARAAKTAGGMIAQKMAGSTLLKIATAAVAAAIIGTSVAAAIRLGKHLNVPPNTGDIYSIISITDILPPDPVVTKSTTETHVTVAEQPSEDSTPIPQDTPLEDDTERPDTKPANANISPPDTSSTGAAALSTESTNTSSTETPPTKTTTVSPSDPAATEHIPETLVADGFTFNRFQIPQVKLSGEGADQFNAKLMDIYYNKFLYSNIIPGTNTTTLRNDAPYDIQYRYYTNGNILTISVHWCLSDLPYVLSDYLSHSGTNFYNFLISEKREATKADILAYKGISEDSFKRAWKKVVTDYYGLDDEKYVSMATSDEYYADAAPYLNRNGVLCVETSIIYKGESGIDGDEISRVHFNLDSGRTDDSASVFSDYF